MKSPDAPPPDPEFLDTLRRQMAAGAPAGAKARIEERLNLLIGSAPEPRALGARPSGPEQRLPVRFAALAARPIRFGLLMLAFGGALGAVLHARFAEQKERIVYVDRVVETVSQPLSLRPPVAAPMPEDVRPAASSAAAPAAEAGQAAERTLIDRARRAFGAGDYAATERELDRHLRRFPAGMLREEREALRIKVLAATGRNAAARRRAAQFLERFPSSLFGPAVDEAVRSIP